MKIYLVIINGVEVYRCAFSSAEKAKECLNSLGYYQEDNEPLFHKQDSRHSFTGYIREMEVI